MLTLDGMHSLSGYFTQIRYLVRDAFLEWVFTEFIWSMDGIVSFELTLNRFSLCGEDDNDDHHNDILTHFKCHNNNVIGQEKNI